MKTVWICAIILALGMVSCKSSDPKPAEEEPSAVSLEMEGVTIDEDLPGSVKSVLQDLKEDGDTESEEAAAALEDAAADIKEAGGTTDEPALEFEEEPAVEEVLDEEPAGADENAVEEADDLEDLDNEDVIIVQ